MRNRAITAVCVAVLTAGGLAGCSSSSSSSTPDTLTVAQASPPSKGLDPAATGNTNDQLQYFTPAYAPLIGQDQNGKLVPALATKWGYVGDDNKRFEVTLRADAKFADGTPVTAADLVATGDHFREGSGNGTTYFKGITVKAQGRYKLVYTSKTPDPRIPTLLTAKWMAGSAISSKGLENPKALKTKTFGAGPYTLDPAQSVQGDHYVYVPNEHYWDQAAIHYKKIVIRVIGSTTSQLQALKNGQIDAMYTDSATAKSADGVSGLKIVSKPASIDGVFLLDRDGALVPALKDVRVRQALNYAVDRRSLVSAIYGEYGAPTAIPNIDGGPSYGADPSLDEMYSYDPEKAKRLLADAGYAKGFTLVCLYSATTPNEDAMLQAVASQWAKVGVTLKLKPESSKGAWVSAMFSKRYPATGLNAAGKPAVMQVPGFFMPGGIMNPFGVSSPPMETAQEAMLNADPVDAAKLATDAMRIAMEEALMVPVVVTDDVFIVDSSDVEGVQFMTDEALLMPVETWKPKP